MRVIWTTSTVSRCSIGTRSMSSPSVGASTVTVMQRTSLSQVICVSPSEPPSAIAAMVCRFRISEGNIGLMQALKRFEPERGFRFATYAVWWIRASIQDYILRSWSLVKIGTTANQKKLFFKLRSAKAKIAALDHTDLRPEQVTAIATTLGVKDQEVVNMNRRLGGDASLNVTVRDEGNSGEWQDYLVDESPSPEAIVVEQDEMDHRQEALVRAIAVLNDRERRIFEARHLIDEPKTLEDLAIEFKVSRERIRQIEVRAFEKVRTAAKISVRERRARVTMHA